MVTAAGPCDRGARVAWRRANPTVPAIVLVAVLLVMAVEPLRVTSGSMSPTLTAGDQIVIDKVSGHWRPPTVGDLVVFREPVHRELVIKRVVALGGQTVALENGTLFVDRARRVEPHVDLTGVDWMYFGPVTVPPDALFVLGDNRYGSVDSRTYGSIRVDEVVGRVVLTF